MKERPILFSAPMVRAILSGSKRQTRRAVKIDGIDFFGSSGDDVDDPACWGFESDAGHWWALAPGHGVEYVFPSPYGQPGERLWVRETFMDLGACYLYRADQSAERERAIAAPGQRWKPAIHMPRAASRITDISEADSVAEGIPSGEVSPPDAGRFAYRLLWESINGPGSWDANPWVWVVSFQRIQPRNTDAK
jgi:hypothetical protein